MAIAEFQIIDEMRRRAFAALVPPPQVPLSEWIEAQVRLPEGLCACPGPMRLYSYQREIADCYRRPGNRAGDVAKGSKDRVQCFACGGDRQLLRQ